MPRCLVITKLLPIPDNGGGKQRTRATLERLARRADVTLAAFDDADADHQALGALGVEVLSVPWPVSRAQVAKGLVRSGSVTAARFWHDLLAEKIRSAADGRPFDSLVVEYAQLAPLSRGVASRRFVYASHNVESELIRSYAKTRGAIGRIALEAEAASVRNIERRLLRRADVVSVVSDADRHRLASTSAQVLVCPNGCNPGEVLAPSPEPTAVFVAQLGWAPNVDAATWLAGEIWPRVRQAVPGAGLLFVGRNPSPRVEALAGDGIEVTGTVPDVLPYLRRARVALAPLRAAGGSRLKILEALGVGRPVVATTLGAEGLEDLVGSGVIVADRPDQLADAVVTLLEDPARGAEVGRLGHAAVTARYSWDSTVAPLVDAATG